MPRVNMSGQEKSKFNDWREVQDLIFMNMFESNPQDMDKIRSEIQKFIEENKNVRKDDRREDDRKSS